MITQWISKNCVCIQMVPHLFSKNNFNSDGANFPSNKLFVNSSGSHLHSNQQFVNSSGSPLALQTNVCEIKWFPIRSSKALREFKWFSHGVESPLSVRPALDGPANE